MRAARGGPHPGSAQLQVIDHHVCQNPEVASPLHVDPPRLAVHHAEQAQIVPVGSAHRHADKETQVESAANAQFHDRSRRVSAAQTYFRRVEAMTRFEPKTVVIAQGDDRDGRIEQIGGQGRNAIEYGLRRSVQNLVATHRCQMVGYPMIGHGDREDRRARRMARAGLYLMQHGVRAPARSPHTFAPCAADHRQD